MSLGKLIREYRLKANLTQSQLASKVNATQTTVSDWEWDKQKPSDLSLVVRTLNIPKSRLEELNTVDQDPVIKAIENDPLLSRKHKSMLIEIYKVLRDN